MQARKTNRTVSKMVKMVVALAVAVGTLTVGTGCDEDYNFGYGTGFRSGHLNQQEVPLNLGDIDCWFSGGC